MAPCRNAQRKVSKETTGDTKNRDFFVRSSKSDDGERKKKPFNKNKWRLQKYSMKHKIENWEDRRKKAILHSYNKEQRRNDDSGRFDVNKIYEEEEKRSHDDDHSKNEESDEKQRKNHRFKSIHEKFLDKQEEKQRKKEELLKIKAEKEEALKKYKQKKIEKYKKLNRKTKKGQPIMKERLEYLLEKIQKSIDV